MYKSSFFLLLLLVFDICVFNFYTVFVLCDDMFSLKLTDNAHAHVANMTRLIQYRSAQNRVIHLFAHAHIEKSMRKYSKSTDCCACLCACLCAFVDVCIRYCFVRAVCATESTTYIHCNLLKWKCQMNVANQRIRVRQMEMCVRFQYICMHVRCTHS